MIELVGQLVGGKYRITKKLGAGGVADVFEATHETLGQRFAVKVLKPEYLDQPELTERFLTEGRAASAVGHPGIIQVFDIGHLPTGEPYLVMELLQGEDLKQVLARKGRLSEPEAITVALHVLEALGAAHKAGVLHRDLKPENVVLVRGPEGQPWAKLIDFGIARELTRDPSRRVTRLGTVVGTPAFMAPEQVRGLPNVDARADLYAVGVMLYEMVTGELPYRGESVTEIMLKVMKEEFPPPRRAAPDLSPELDKVIVRAAAKSPDRRFASADEFIRALRALRSKYVADREWRDEDAPELADSTSMRRLHELVHAEFDASAKGAAAHPGSAPPPPPAEAARPRASTVVISRRMLYLLLAFGVGAFVAAAVIMILVVLRGG